ncbi:MAG: tRNA (N6-threonylcarbamoyladenosine(37)-N6)-methyltransferase TrmO [Eubacterium sp.]|nr:tRNA (N6-threonylcarbamoyladenosine(37)-N6)-methyltransferase TrmO [Eubacterium sp.]
MNKTITPIAHIHTDYTGKFGIPRQCGLVNSEAEIVFLKDYSGPDCIRELEGYSHIWLIWGFSENEKSGWSPTVRPPRLGGNKRVGVFASRSPFRPNGLGLSVVKLERITITKERGPVLTVVGADLMDQTPIYDIKPYIPASDAIPDALSGYSGRAKDKHLSIHYEAGQLDPVPESKRKALLEVLSLDPRPSYQDDPDRVYGMTYAGHEIHFKVCGNDLYITDISVFR